MTSSEAPDAAWVSGSFPFFFGCFGPPPPVGGGGTHSSHSRSAHAGTHAATERIAEALGERGGTREDPHRHDEHDGPGAACSAIQRESSSFGTGVPRSA